MLGLVSTAERVIAVREGAVYRAELRKGGAGLGVTVKATLSGAILILVVHALPR